MKNLFERALSLKSLHIKGNPLILFNVWDAGSAQTVQEMGTKAIATSSWSVAAAHGYEDGEKIPFDLVLTNLQRIIATTHLPVTIDIEGAYGHVKDKVTKVIEAGAVGINIEDQIMGHNELYSIEDQCKRITAAREAAEQASIPLFINARTDLFLKDSDSQSRMEEANRRCEAYAVAGADGFFTPGLQNAKHIEKLCKLSPLPINIMILPDTPSPKHLSELGVARISYGPAPYCQAMDALKEASRKAFTKI